MMDNILYPNGSYGLFVFLLVTLVLGSAAAWTTGRAIARTWRPVYLVPVYMLGLAAAVRFLHYALFGELFFTPHYYVADYAVLFVAAGLGYRRMRAWQMVQQYGWSFASRGAFFWREKEPLDSVRPFMG
jgi:hypothetical protein